MEVRVLRVKIENYHGIDVRHRARISLKVMIPTKNHDNLYVIFKIVMLEVGPLLSPSKNKSLSFPLINDTALPYNTLYI